MLVYDVFSSEKERQCWDCGTSQPGSNAGSMIFWKLYKPFYTSVFSSVSCNRNSCSKGTYDDLMLLHVSTWNSKYSINDDIIFGKIKDANVSSLGRTAYMTSFLVFSLPTYRQRKLYIVFSI